MAYHGPQAHISPFPAEERLGACARLFEHLRSVTAYFLFPSWHSLLRTIITGLPPPQPA